MQPVPQNCLLCAPLPPHAGQRLHLPPPSDSCWTRELTAAGGGKVNAELGAAWVHGITGNPIVQLARQAGVSLAAKPTNYENAWLYLANGDEPTSAQEAK